MSIFLSEPSLAVYIYIFIYILGIIFGSFLNVLIFRIPKGEEFIKTSSHCLTCGHKLAWYDNIPILSWIILGGKCRYCKTKLSIQYPLIEAINGFIWLLTFFIIGPSLRAILVCFVASGLLALSVIDWRTYEISNGFHIYFIIIAIINILLSPDNWIDCIIGFFAVSILLLIIYLVSKGTAIGGGDVKLMAACGLFLGWEKIILALAIGCIVGSIIHVTRMKASGAGKVLAMGPYLAFGVYISSICGQEIIDWYISFLA